MQQLIHSRFKYNPRNPYKPSVSGSQLQLIDLIKSKLDSGEYKLEKTVCSCGAEDKDINIAQIDRYGLPLSSVLCLSCGTVRFNPYLDESSLSDFYTHIYRKMYGMDQESGSYDSYFLSQSSYAEKILAISQSFLKPESWVCEVGCGGGGALKVFQDNGYNVAGCDYDSVVMEMGKQRGVKNLYYGSLDAIESGLSPIKFDLIYLHHVFEHLNDPVAFLENCQKYLSPSGKIIIVVPDLRRIDQFGHPSAIGNLLMYLHIAHKYNFSYEGIQRLCKRAGYSATKLHPDPKIKTPWSESPEFWVQISLETEDSLAENQNQKPSDTAGDDMLKYLQRTEKLYSLGLCKGQVLNKIKTLKSPDKVLEKIKGLHLLKS